jgi:ABC-2 type transport system permease protein
MRALAKYVAIARLAARQGLSQRGELAGRIGFFLVLLLIFSRLWKVVLSQTGLLPLSARQMLWYLALTEWILLSLPELHLEMEADVRGGEIAYRLSRPASYLFSRLAEGLGVMLARLAVLGVAGFVLTVAMAGGLPENAAGLWVAVPFGVAAASVALVFLSCIGLFAIWLQDVSPIYWVWQKLAFVLGGLILPMDIYPHWLRQISAWTPFYPILYGTGRLAFESDLSSASTMSLRLVAWSVALVGVTLWIYRRGLARLDVNGG